MSDFAIIIDRARNRRVSDRVGTARRRLDDVRPVRAVPVPCLPVRPRSIRRTLYAAALALVAGIGCLATGGLGLAIGMINVPQISVVEVARAGVLPRCEEYEREKGVCVR